MRHTTLYNVPSFHLLHNHRWHGISSHVINMNLGLCDITYVSLIGDPGIRSWVPHPGCLVSGTLSQVSILLSGSNVLGVWVIGLTHYPNLHILQIFIFFGNFGDSYFFTVYIYREREYLIHHCKLQHYFMQYICPP